MKKSRTIIITGTHHTPAIELIQELQSDDKIDWKIHYVGHLSLSDNHIRRTIIPKLKIIFHNLDCGKYDRYSLFHTIIGIPKTAIATFKSILLIRRIRPNIVVSFGGYVSVPVIFASYLYRIPSITHEQTLTISLSTKINSLFVNKIALSFDNYAELKKIPAKKVVVTGNLIRQNILNNHSSLFSSLEKHLHTNPLISIIGGNQGSQFINNLVKKLLPKLRHFTIIHQTGTLFSEQTRKRLSSRYQNYHPLEYIEANDIGWVLNHSEILISRAGANSCQEINLLNIKSILIPLPNTQQNEQVENAKWLQKSHPQTTVIISQEDASSQKVLNSIKRLFLIKVSKINKKIPKYNQLFYIIHEYV